MGEVVTRCGEEGGREEGRGGEVVTRCGEGRQGEGQRCVLCWEANQVRGEGRG